MEEKNNTNEIKKQETEVPVTDNENIYTPSSKKYITDDGSVVDLIGKAKLFYLEENLSKKSIQMKEITFPYLMVYDEIEGTFNESATNKNKIEKFSFLVKEMETKNKNIKINLNTVSYARSIYQVTYALKKGGTEKKMITANKKTIQLLADYYLAKGHNKYLEENGIVKIEKIEDEKDFFQKLATRKSSNMSISKQEMMVLTQKLYTVIKNNPSSPANTILKEIISQIGPSGLKNVLIEVRQLVKEQNLDIVEAFKMFPEHFDTVFISMIEAGFKQGGESKINALAELKSFTERNFVLDDSVKKALRGPIGGIIFLLIIAGVLAVKSVPMIKDMYESLGAPVPELTVMLGDFIDFLIGSWYIYVPAIISLKLVLTYFFQNTFYGMKVWHDFMLTLPIVGRFFRNKDYEAFCTLVAMLSGGGKNSAAVLKIAKKVIKNYHLKGVINTAIIKVSKDKILPGEIMGKFPQYIDPRISGILSKRDNPTEDLLMLKKIYASENDDFITTFPMTIKPVMNIVMAFILIFLISATIFPIYGLLSAIE